jgi:tryptophan halogenase
MVCPDDARADAAQFRHIKIKHGVHERAWERNVVGIGLANGFIEPLESTGLMLTHEAIMKMCAALEMRNGNITKLDIDMFNHAFREQIIGFKDFISQHYALSMRDDTPYWKAVTSKTYSKEMVDFVPSLYNGYIDVAHRIHRGHAFNHDMSGIIYIAAGMGYSPVNSKFTDFMDAKYYETPGYELDVWNKWQEFKQRQMQIIDGLPTHYQFLKENIHKN